MPEVDSLTLPEVQAYRLTETGIALGEAFEKKNDLELAAALEDNLQLWVAIKTVINLPSAPLPKDVRDNLLRLFDFVAAATLKDGVNITDETLNTLLGINLQISQGLLEGFRSARH